MKIAVAMTVLAVLGLGACSQPQGAGFSGIGFEGGAIAGATTSAGARQISPQLGTVPFHQTTSGSGNLTDMAELAIRTGGTVPGRSTLVQVAGQSLALSLVQVDQTPFAVLRVPAGQSQLRMTRETRTDFAARIGALTGCTATHGVYGLGDAKRSFNGLATPVEC